MVSGILRLEGKKRKETYVDDDRRRIFESRPLHAWGVGLLGLS